MIWRLSLALVVGAALWSAPPSARAQNLTFGEVKLGVLAHDADFLGGTEGGVDINPEIIFASPVPDAWAATVPPSLPWMVQPRPPIGGETHSSAYTNRA